MEQPWHPDIPARARALLMGKVDGRLVQLPGPTDDSSVPLRCDRAPLAGSCREERLLKLWETQFLTLTLWASNCAVPGKSFQGPLTEHCASKAVRREGASLDPEGAVAGGCLGQGPRGTGTAKAPCTQAGASPPSVDDEGQQADAEGQSAVPQRRGWSPLPAPVANRPGSVQRAPVSALGWGHPYPCNPSKPQHDCGFIQQASSSCFAVGNSPS